MNLVWHIVKKDFTRLRLPLALWTGLLLGTLILSERMFSAGSIETEWFVRHVGILGVTTFVGVIVCYILAAAVALEDTLVGSQMFWVTRPISGGRLLAAKLFGAALFLILWPVLVAAPWWLWCGFGLREFGEGALQVMALQALLVLPALTLAALAGQSSRFLLWTLVALLAVPAGTGLVAYYLPKDLSQELIQSRVILAYLTGAVTAGTVIWLQYRSRRLVRSVVVTVAGAAVAVLIGFCWPADLTGLWPKDTSQLPGAEKISVTIDEAQVRAKDGKAWVSFKFLTKDIPLEFGILTGESQVEFRWPDGTTLLRRGKVIPVNPDYSARHLLNLPPVQPDPATEEKIAQMREATIKRSLERGEASPVRVDRPVLIVNLDVPPELAAKFATPPAVRVKLRLQTGRAELLAEIPLKEGAGQVGKGVRLKLLKLEPVDSAPPAKPATQLTATVITAQPTRMKFLQFLLVDRVHGTVIMEGASLIPAFRATVLPLGINRSTLRLNIPQLWRDDQWIGMPEWLEKDTLAVVTYRPNGGFDRELQAEKLEFVKK